MEDHQEVFKSVNYTGSSGGGDPFNMIVKKQMNTFGLNFIFIGPRESEKVIRMYIRLEMSRSLDH